MSADGRAPKPPERAATGPVSPKPAAQELPQPAKADCRAAFAETLIDLAASDPRIVALANDSLSSSNLKEFQRRFPDRMINIGIAEQNLVGVSAGLASAGKIPFTCSASCFLTGRALEQVKADVAYSRHNVKLCGMSSGMAYGELGATHHSIEDLAWTRALANLTVIVPADPSETAQAVRAAAAIDGPVFLRLSRMPVPPVHGPDYVFEVGRAARLRDGSDVTVIATGVTVHIALEAATSLEAEGIDAAVLNMSTIRPLDREAIVEAAARGPIVTVEEHTVYGGLGSAVAEVVVETRPVRMRLVGVPGVFAPTGSTQFLLEHFGISVDGIRKAVHALVSQ
jgi:transketolase